MTLTVEGDAGLGQQDQAAIHNKWDTIDEAEFDLARMGFFSMEKPDFAAPELNAELYQKLSSADGNTITFEHTRWSAWYSYSHSKLGYFSGVQKQIENEMKEILVRTKREIIKRANTAAEKKPTKDDIEHEALIDDRYMQLKRDLQKVEQVIDLLDSHRLKYSAGVKLTSRAVTVRGQEIEAGTGGRAYGNSYRGDGGM
jgi:hypothetical protein